jgi:hypothetical protein
VGDDDGDASFLSSVSSILGSFLLLLYPEFLFDVGRVTSTNLRGGGRYIFTFGAAGVAIVSAFIAGGRRRPGI